MGMIGTFDGFTTARLGIYAAQHGLRVTGNNISNINTTGYTRQRIEQESMKTGGADMYRSPYDNHVGNGALVTGINQIRDPYLDIQFRTTNSKVGYTDAWLSGLNDIAKTLDEVGKGMVTNRTEEGDGILYAQMLDMADMLRQLMNNPCKDNDTLVRNSAETLCQLFNSYGRNLEGLQKDLDAHFQTELASVNEILTNIRNLNETIRNAEIVGDRALELRDERNRQLDSLSEYMHIKVEYVMEDIGGGKQVEKLIVSLGNANPDPESHTDETVLVDGVYGSQIKCTNGVPLSNPDFDATKTPGADNPRFLKADGTATDDEKEAATLDYVLSVTNLVDSKNVLPKNHNTVNAGRPITLADNDLYGSFQAMRELLTEKGEFSTAADVAADPNAVSKRGIPYYQMSLDLLARKFAELYNSLNQGAMLDTDDNVIYTAVSGTPEDLGLKLMDKGFGEGYYVDEKGFFIGKSDPAHNPCLLTQAQIHKDDSLKTALNKISGVTTDPALKDQIKAVLDSNGEVLSDKTEEAEKIVADFLGLHGVTDSNGAQVEVNMPKYPEGTGPLFSNRNDGDNTEGITASNISVSHSWSTGAVQVVPKFKELFDGDVTDSTQNVNIDHMISAIDKSLVYNPKDLDPNSVSSKLFEGSFNDMFNNMGGILANDQRTTNVDLNNNYTMLVQIDTSRDGVSGVDLNDEAMNIMQFQKAYSAACRFMTAIDEVLERLINNTGIAGR